MAEWDTPAPTGASEWDSGAVPPPFEDNFTTNDFSGDADAIDAGYDAGGGGGADGGCRNCGQEGHFARECPEPRQSRGGCFNCGEEGHSKAECPNPAVAREFTGTCNYCQGEGHRAAECPTKPADKCRKCHEEGHKATECESDVRVLDYAGVPDMPSVDAWRMLVDGAKEKDLDDVKLAIKALLKGDRAMTYADVQTRIIAENLQVCLIAQEKELPLGMTSVSPQGKEDCKYIIGHYYAFKPKRAKFAEGWPASPEENLERLKEDTGVAMETAQPVCRRCDQMGHTSKTCPEERVEVEQPKISCSNCNQEGHRLRDCTEPREQRGGGGGRECRICSQTGHMAKDCPEKTEGGGGGPRACRNCGSEDHIAKECDQPRNPATITCRNCEQMGHMSRECPEPKDWSKVQCTNCQEFGHTKVRCKQPAADEEMGGGEYDGGGGDFNAGGGDDFGAAPAGDDFGSGGAAVDGDWNTAAPAPSGDW